MKERIIKINEELKKIEDQLGKFKTLAGSAKGGAYNVMDLTGIFQAMRHDVQAIDELVLQNQNLSADEVNANKVSFKEAAEKFEGLKNTYSQRKREFADVAGRAFLNYDVVRDTNKKFDNTSKHFGSVVDLMDKGGYLANSGKKGVGQVFKTKGLALVLAASLFFGGAGLVAGNLATRGAIDKKVGSAYSQVIGQEPEKMSIQDKLDAIVEAYVNKNGVAVPDAVLGYIDGLVGEYGVKLEEGKKYTYSDKVDLILEAAVAEREAEITRLNGVISQKDAEIEQKDARITELEGLIANTNPNDSETIKNLKAELRKAQAERDQAIKDKATAVAEKEAVQKLYNKAVKDLEEKDKTIAEKDKTIAEKDKTISEKDAKIKSLNEEITGLKSSKTALEQKVAKLEKDLKAEQDKNTQNQAEIKRLQGELKTANDALAQVKKDLASKTAECEELKARDNVKASNALIDWYCEITGTDPSTLSAKDMDSIIAIMNEFMGEPADPVITNQNEQQQPREDHTSQNGQQNEEPDDSYTQDENGLINGGGW